MHTALVTLKQLALATIFGKANLVATTLPLLFALSQMVYTAPDLPVMDKAEWIWVYPEAVQRGGGEAYFRTTFRLDQEVASAKVYITADNGYELLVNNRKVAEKLGAGGDIWGTMNLLDIASFLVPNASNVIAIRAVCLGGSAGLIASFRVTLRDGTVLDIPTGSAWRATEEPAERWWESDHNDSKWTPAAPMGKLGIAPWGRIALPTALTDPKTLPVQVTGAVRLNDSFVTLASLDDYDFPAGVVFIEGRAPDTSTPLATTNFRIRETRAYWENDVPAPSISGPRLYKLVPARPDGVKTLLLDAGEGLIGSPIASFDGKTIYFCMAKRGVEPVAGERLSAATLSEAFFHIYQIDSDGKNLTQLTDGLWHDTDPCPMPDGSIVFSSTRTGARDEYHANAAHSLYKRNPDGRIEPITVHVTADADPELMADGRIAFVRHDNFLERAKVETHIHCVRPDGTAGEVIIGPDRQAIAYDMQTAAEHDAFWLRSYGFGSPAPLPDGRVVALSHSGPVITTLGAASENNTAPLDDAASPGRAQPSGKQTAYDVVPMPCRVSLVDLGPLPDGRLVVSTMHNSLAVVDPETGTAAQIFKSKEPVHSVCYLGERATPREWVSTMSEDVETIPRGFLYAANVFSTKQTQAEWERVKAVRVWRGDPLTLRAALHQYGHIGSVGVELGSVPLMPDGSFYVEVPADVPLAIQAVDAAGRAVVSELSWIYTRPGEFRSCIGCHAEKSATSGSSGVSPSIQSAPLDLTLSRRPPRFRANNGANGGVLNLQIERMRETISVDLYSDPLTTTTTTTVPMRGRRDEITQLARALESPDAGTRFSAVQRLQLFRPRLIRGKTETPSILRTLEKVAVSDDNTTLRVQATLALSVFGTSESLAPLVALLGDEHPSVVQAANVALEHITGRNVIAPETPSRGVVARSADDWKTWLGANPLAQIEAAHRARIVPRGVALSREESLAVRFALESLARIGREAETAAAVRTLLKERGSLDLLTQLAAVRVLGELGNVDEVPLLTEILRETCRREFPPHQHNPEFGWAAMRDHTGGAAAVALTQIAAFDPTARAAVVAALQDAVLELGEFWFYTNRTADHPWLMGSVSGIIQFRLLEGLLALEIKPSEARKNVVERIVSNLPIDSDRGILLESDSYETVTARLLWQLDAAPQILDAALDTLLQHENVNKDLSAAVVVSPPAMSTGELDAMSRAAQWVATLASCNEPQCRDDARFGSRIRAAFEFFRSGEPSRMRSWTCFMLARGLGRLGDAAAAPLLVSALMDEPTEFDFGCYPPPHIFLNRAMTPVHRAAAADALGRIGDASAASVLIAVVNDTKNMMDVRQAAAWGLGHLAARNILDPATLKQIEKLATDYPEFYTRRALGMTDMGINRERLPETKGPQ